MKILHFPADVLLCGIDSEPPVLLGLKLELSHLARYFANSISEELISDDIVCTQMYGADAEGGGSGTSGKIARCRFALSVGASICRHHQFSFLRARNEEARSVSPNGLSKRKRDRSEMSHDDNSSDDPGDPNDVDYVSESSVSSRRLKRARQTAVRRAPTRPRHNGHPRRNGRSRRNISRLSVDEDAHPKVAMDQGPMSGLSDMETIPIRGFLTREILLSKVIYSITFEEQKGHPCLQESGGTPQECENEGQHNKQPHQKGTRKPTAPTRFLPRDNQLLIELKEKRGPPWKRIAEYFPERSEGSLQVRYCTRLKSRPGGRHGCSYNGKDNTFYKGVSCEESRLSCGLEVTSNRCMGTRGLSRQRYGPLGAGKPPTAIPQFKIAALSTFRVSTGKTNRQWNILPTRANIL